MTSQVNSSQLNNSQIDDEQELPEHIIQIEANRIRKQYRTIRENITENRLEYLDPNSNAIEDALDNVENTFKRVKKPREAVSDSHVLLELAILGKERIKNVQCVFRSFNNNEFMEKMKSYMVSTDKKRKINLKDEPESERDETDEVDDDEEERTTSKKSTSARKSTSSAYVMTKPILENFGKKCINHFNVLPRPTFLLGSLNKEIMFTQRKVRQKRQTERNLDVVKTKIKELEVNSKENEENSTVIEIERIYELLKKYYKKTKGEAICFYTFVINPFSFSRTIENIFYVSFLIKDNYAKILLDADGLPVIEPIVEDDQKSYNPNDAMNRKKKNTTNIQSMVSMTKSQWKEMIEVFDIKTALIKEPK